MWKRPCLLSPLREKPPRFQAFCQSSPVTFSSFSLSSLLQQAFKNLFNVFPDFHPAESISCSKTCRLFPSVLPFKTAFLSAEKHTCLPASSRKTVISPGIAAACMHRTGAELQTSGRSLPGSRPVFLRCRSFPFCWSVKPQFPEDAAGPFSREQYIVISRISCGGARPSRSHLSGPYASGIQVQTPGFRFVFHAALWNIWRKMCVSTDKNDSFLSIHNPLQLPVPVQIGRTARLPLWIMRQKRRVAENHSPAPAALCFFFFAGIPPENGTVFPPETETYASGPPHSGR